MANEFKKLVSEKSDEEILAILASSEGDYIVEVMELAKEEFETRGLSSDKLEEAKLKYHYNRQLETENMNSKNVAVSVILWVKIGILLLFFLSAFIAWCIKS